MNIEQTVSSIQRKNGAKMELRTAYMRLNSFIDSINNKINGRIQLVTQVYIKDYEAQITLMTEELKNIRTVLDEELLRQRANQRLFFLEEERDFFRGQVMKLNEELTNLTKTNTSLKEQLEESKAEAENYKSLVVGLQRKILKIQHEAFENEKLRQSSSVPVFTSSLQAVDSKQTISIFPSKPTLTRYFQGDSPLSGRTTFHSVQLARDKSEQVLDREVKRKEQILEQCIRDIKKKIFYRTLGDESKKMHFEQHKKISFDKFTRTDKEDLVRSILSDHRLLQQFYAFMTNSMKEGENSPSRFPQGIKTSLNDKIFKIKLRGVSRDYK